MSNTLKKILNSKYNHLVLCLSIFTLYGIYLYFDRPNVSSRDNLIEINGTLDYVEKVLIDYKKIRKTELDSTYHIFLRDYPCKFQVSYMPFDSKDFYKSALPGDKITLHIASEDFDRLEIPKVKIRSFSLTLNNKVYLSAESGLRGFGKGYFELGLIVITLTINIFVINEILKNKGKTAKNAHVP